MSHHSLHLIAVAGSLMVTMPANGQEPMVIQPARIQANYFYARSAHYESVLSILEVVITKDKIINRAGHGESSGLGVYDLNTLEEELRFYFGRFAHKGRIKEDKKKIEYDLAKAALGKYIEAIWDPRNANPYADEYRKRNKGRLLAEYFKVIATEKEQIARAWFESLQENKRPANGERPPGQPYGFIGDSGMYGGSVTAVSPDGSYFHCWQSDQTEPEATRKGYWVFDLKTEQKRPSPFKFRGIVDQPFKISPDGKWGVVRSINPTLTDPITGDIKKELEYPYHIVDVVFSPDSKYVAAIGGEAYVWEVGTWKRLGTLNIDRQGKAKKGVFRNFRMLRTTPQYAEFSPSGRFLFHRGIESGTWDLAQPDKPKRVTSKENTYVIWDVRKDHLVTSIPMETLAHFEGWGPTDDLVFLSETDHLALVHLPTGKTIAKLMQPPDGVSRILPLVDTTQLPFRTFCRASDGLVLSEYIRQAGEFRGMKDYEGRLIRWDLKPQMAEILKRAEALNAERKP